MKRSNIDATEKQNLESLIATNAPGVQVLKKILKHYMNELQDVRHIDPKGNVGLQTVSAQRALEILAEFEQEVFFAHVPRVGVMPGQKPQPRPYQ